MSIRPSAVTQNVIGLKCYGVAKIPGTKPLDAYAYQDIPLTACPAQNTTVPPWELSPVCTNTTQKISEIFTSVWGTPHAQHGGMACDLCCAHCAQEAGGHQAAKKKKEAKKQEEEAAKMKKEESAAKIQRNWRRWRKHKELEVELPQAENAQQKCQALQLPVSRCCVTVRSTSSRGLSKIFKQWVELVSKDHWKQYNRAGMPTCQ
eukprot:3938475-Rhodomonas_salina.1